MNLMKFKGADDTVKLTTRLLTEHCIILTTAFASNIIFLINRIGKAYSRALVINRQGEVYETSSLSASDMRQYEYMNHVKTFVTHWYAFDESSYEKNISFTFSLTGDKGKKLLNEYNSVNMLNSPIQENIRYGVRIEDTETNAQAISASGKIIFTQTGYRTQGSISRNIEAEFTVYDMLSRSGENARGAKIGDWIVRYSEPVENNDVSASQAASPGKNEDQSEASKPTDHGTE